MLTSAPVISRRPLHSSAAPLRRSCLSVVAAGQQTSSAKPRGRTRRASAAPLESKDESVPAAAATTPKRGRPRKSTAAADVVSTDATETAAAAAPVAVSADSTAPQRGRGRRASAIVAEPSSSAVISTSSNAAVPVGPSKSSADNVGIATPSPAPQLYEVQASSTATPKRRGRPSKSLIADNPAAKPAVLPATPAAEQLAAPATSGRRGRPRKTSAAVAVVDESAEAVDSSPAAAAAPAEVSAAPKRKGRPRKTSAAAVQDVAVAATTAAAAADDDTLASAVDAALAVKGRKKGASRGTFLQDDLPEMAFEADDADIRADTAPAGRGGPSKRAGKGSASQRTSRSSPPLEDLMQQEQPWEEIAARAGTAASGNDLDDESEDDLGELDAFDFEDLSQYTSAGSSTPDSRRSSGAAAPGLGSDEADLMGDYLFAADGDQAFDPEKGGYIRPHAAGGLAGGLGDDFDMFDLDLDFDGGMDDFFDNMGDPMGGSFMADFGAPGFGPADSFGAGNRGSNRGGRKFGQGWKPRGGRGDGGRGLGRYTHQDEQDSWQTAAPARQGQQDWGAGSGTGWQAQRGNSGGGSRGGRSGGRGGGRQQQRQQWQQGRQWDQQSSQVNQPSDPERHRGGPQERPAQQPAQQRPLQQPAGGGQKQQQQQQPSWQQVGRVRRVQKSQ